MQALPYVLTVVLLRQLVPNVAAVAGGLLAAGDAEAYATRLLETAGIVVIPGPYFGPGGEGFCRVALVPDLVLDRAVYPVARSVGRVFAWMRWLQLGSINAYLLYILITLVALLLWR